MKLSLATVQFALLFAFAIGHEHSDDTQMPLGYVKYPYQATYPGDDSGTQVPLFLIAP